VFLADVFFWQACDLLT